MPCWVLLRTVCGILFVIIRCQILPTVSGMMILFCFIRYDIRYSRKRFELKKVGDCDFFFCYRSFLHSLFSVLCTHISFSRSLLFYISQLSQVISVFVISRCSSLPSNWSMTLRYTCSTTLSLLSFNILEVTHIVR